MPRSRWLRRWHSKRGRHQDDEQVRGGRYPAFPGPHPSGAISASL